jgi:hypothetical protein
MQKERIEIGLNKVRIGMVVFGILLFLILSIPRFMSSGGGIRWNTILLLSPFLLIVVLILVGAIFKLFEKRAYLALDDQGIHLNLNQADEVLVPWHDVFALEPGKFIGFSYIVVRLKNPEHYLNKLKKGRLSFDLGHEEMLQAMKELWKK